jgi:hypothetical protein
MAKEIIRLTESDLHRIVKESVNRVLYEVKYHYDPNNPDEYEKFDSTKPKDWRTLAYLRRLRRISHENPKSEYYEDPIEGHEAAFEKEDKAMRDNHYNSSIALLGKKEDRDSLERARKIADKQGIDYRGRGYKFK